MGQYCYAPAPSNELDSLLREQLVPLDVGGAIATDPQAKGLVPATDMPSLQEARRNVRASDGTASPRILEDPFPLDRHAEVGQPDQHLFGSLSTGDPAARQEPLQLCVSHVDIIAQEVDLFPSADAADLHPRYQSNILFSRLDQSRSQPFSGVVIPDMVRAVGVNGTGCLKLGINYLMSVKAVDKARQVLPEAGSALFLDDNPTAPLETRKVTEWDSSCCLFGLDDGTVIKIPESSLILPSVTILGICAVLEEMGITVEERDMTYGELIRRSQKDQIVAICSVGTAGIMNRARKLVLVDEDYNFIGTQQAAESHPLFKSLGEARATLWEVYQEKAPVPGGLNLFRFEI